jgi:hypothetical protein
MKRTDITVMDHLYGPNLKKTHIYYHPREPPAKHRTVQIHQVVSPAPIRGAEGEEYHHRE